MSTWLQTIPTPSEYIQKEVKNPSIMLGKDRTILKSFTTGRSVGYFSFFVDDGFQDTIQAVLPLTPVDGLTFVDAVKDFRKTIYTAQKQHHLEIDPILYEGQLPDNMDGYYDTNHPMAILFRDNALLPPNKNVYFRMIATPPFHLSQPFYNFSTFNNPQPQMRFIMFDDTFPIFNLIPNIFTGLRKIVEPTGSTGEWVFRWEPIFIRRTDSAGKIPNMTEKFVAISFPFDTKDYFQRASQTLAQGLTFEVREIKDRYDCGEGNFKFIPRRYQALTDNEWTL